ncbi:hypothetical protein B0H13DRAFT_2566476 [Mycena leptocephala]|nr:hypothetical protein B0H13DRAFT_2566476 [Mycena leptocephala]
MYDTREEISGGRIEKNGKEKYAQPRGGENVEGPPAPPVGKCPPGGGHRKYTAAAYERSASGKSPSMACPWRMSTYLWGKNWLGQAKRLLQNEKEKQPKESSPHLDDDEQLRSDEEQPRAPHNHAGGAWRYRARADIVCGWIEAVVMKKVKSVYNSSDVHPVSDGERRGKARGIPRAQMMGEETKNPGSGNACMPREKPRQPKCHSSALSPQDQNSSGSANICKLHIRKCSTQSMLQQTRRTRTQSRDGTPAQRVKRFKESWADVRKSIRKRRSAKTISFPRRKCRPLESLAPKHARKNPPNSASTQ